MKVMYEEPGSASCVAHASTEEPRSASSGASSESLYALLHDSLVKVITMAGWPIWYTSGGGGASPNNKDCHFAESKLKWCARIDFRRGIQEDDLPGYADVLAKQQNLSSVEGAMHYQRARLCQRSRAELGCHATRLGTRVKQTKHESSPWSCSCS